MSRQKTKSGLRNKSSNRRIVESSNWISRALWNVFGALARVRVQPPWCAGRNKTDLDINWCNENFCSESITQADNQQTISGLSTAQLSSGCSTSFYYLMGGN